MILKHYFCYIEINKLSQIWFDFVISTHIVMSTFNGVLLSQQPSLGSVSIWVTGYLPFIKQSFQCHVCKLFQISSLKTCMLAKKRSRWMWICLKSISDPIPLFLLGLLLSIPSIIQQWDDVCLQQPKASSKNIAWHSGPRWRYSRMFFSTCRQSAINQGRRF